MSAAGFEIEWISEEERFAAIAAEWDALLPADSSPFDLHCWYELWWRAFGGTRKLAVCTVWRDGKLSAALPLADHRGRLQGMVNGHSGFYRALHADPESLQALCAAALARSSPEIQVSALPSEDPSLQGLVAAAREGSRLALSEPGYTSPIVETSGEFQAWFKGEHKSWKGRIARYRRKIEREHEAKLEIVVAPDDLDAWLDEGFRLEASGWKGEAGTAIESNPDTASFYRELARTFHEREALRLSRIVLDGTDVAFSFCLQHGERLYSLKVGYDESLKKVVPGLIMQLAIVERCFELDLEAYELLGDENDWKRKVSTATREHTDLRIYPRTPAGAGHHFYRRRLRPLLKRTYRRVRPAKR